MSSLRKKISHYITIFAFQDIAVSAGANVSHV